MISCGREISRGRVNPKPQTNCFALPISIFNFGGEGGIRTHVTLASQTAFEAVPLRPLRYLSVFLLNEGIVF
jgi:hypothetical protein